MIDYSTAKYQLIQMGNFYSHDPTDSLAYESVMNRYWRQLSHASQSNKDTALDFIQSIRSDCKSWPFHRYHIAAAIYIGATLNENILITAIRMGDVGLIKLILTQFTTDETIFTYVKTVQIAQALIDYKVRPNLNSLVSVLDSGYQCELIDLYIKSGADLMSRDKQGWNIFHHLAFVTYHYCQRGEIFNDNQSETDSINELQTKVNQICSYLDRATIRAMLRSIDDRKQTPIDVLNIFSDGVAFDIIHKLYTQLG